MILNVLKSTNQQEILDAHNQICLNSGIPKSDTIMWSNILRYENYFYIPAPNENGWGDFTQNQLMQNVSLEISQLEILEEIF